MKKFNIINYSTLIELNPYELSIYNALLSYADYKSGICFPSYKTIMTATKIKSRTTISKYIKSLERKGYIEVTNVFVKSNNTNQKINNIYKVNNTKVLSKSVMNVRNKLHFNTWNELKEYMNALKSKVSKSIKEKTNEVVSSILNDDTEQYNSWTRGSSYSKHQNENSNNKNKYYTGNKFFNFHQRERSQEDYAELERILLTTNI